MHETNPYASSSAPPIIAPDLMRVVAIRMNAWRLNPPTVWRLMTAWPGTPLLAAVGIIGTVVYWLFSVSENAMLTSHWPVGIACFVAGGILRDFGSARRIAKIWPAQSEFIKWEKVDEFID